MTDDQLVLLDVLFDQDCPVDALQDGEAMALRFNLERGHRWGRVELVAELERLERLGILRSHAGSSPSTCRVVGLTAHGGALWECERQPCWSRYCADASYEHEDGGWVLSVRSPSKAMARAFVEAAHACGIYRRKTLDAVSEREACDVALVPWRRFASVHVLEGRLAEPQPSALRADWATFEERRTWWRSVQDLRRDREGQSSGRPQWRG